MELAAALGAAPPGGLKHGGIKPPEQPTPAADRPMNSAIFLTYVTRCPVPGLKPADIVVMNNLKPHKAAGVREAIEAAGAKLLCLPPYSSDLNPSSCSARLKFVAIGLTASRWPSARSALPVAVHRGLGPCDGCGGAAN